jgi:hypothetical protein
MKPVLFLFYISLAAASARASIDFNPQVAEQALAGIVFKQLIFHEQNKPIAYQQPRGWSYSADAGRIRFTPPDVAQAHAVIEQSPLSAPQKFDEKTTKVLEQDVLNSVPNATNLRMIGTQANPVIINSNETYEVTVEYELYGQRFTTSVIFMNLPDTQVRFRLASRKEDFEKLNKAFRASLYSWQWQ